METLEDINPKIYEMLGVVAYPSSLMGTLTMGGKPWTEVVRLDKFFPNFKEAISEVLEYFKSNYPSFFEV